MKPVDRNLERGVGVWIEKEDTSQFTVPILLSSDRKMRSISVHSVFSVCIRMYVYMYMYMDICMLCMYMYIHMHMCVSGVQRSIFDVIPRVLNTLGLSLGLGAYRLS